jgi:hypothetical protein
MKTDDIKISKPNDIITRSIILCGTTPIMFDRYAGDNKTQLEPFQKLYFQPGTKVIGLPALNIMSFLSAHNTNSAPKRLRDARQFKKIANACLSYVQFNEAFIPFIRDDQKITFNKFDQDEFDASSGIYVHHAVARLEKGIPNPKSRPVLPDPWELHFTLSIYPNKEIKEVEIQNLFEDGGRALGLGTFRGVFGKFYVKKWD